MHALRLPSMRLHERTERREVNRRPHAIGRVIDAGEHHGVAPEDLRPIADVEVRGDADDFGHRLHQLASCALERRPVGSCARPLEHERDEHVRGHLGGSARSAGRAGTGRRVSPELAKVDRAKRSTARRIERREDPAGRLGRADALAQGGRDRGKCGREDAASRDVDDVVAAAAREQPDRGAGGDDQLRAGTVRDDRVCPDDRLGRHGVERRITPDRIDDPRALVRELLVIREIEEGAAAAAVSVIAGDARGHREGRRRP